MNTALPPDADFVDLEFVPPGRRRERPGGATTDAAAVVRALRAHDGRRRCGGGVRPGEA